MRVLVLGNKDLKQPEEFPDIFREFGDEPLAWDKRFDSALLAEQKIEFIVSYRCRFLIKEPILSNYAGRVINLHPSYLPWCRGYFPNFWSFVDETPKGVTIHHIDATIDTGDIIAQREFFFEDKDTLRTSYDALHLGLLNLFRENWQSIKSGKAPRISQAGMQSTLHYKADFDRVAHLLPNGWDTPIGVVRAMVKAGAFTNS